MSPHIRWSRWLVAVWLAALFLAGCSDSPSGSRGQVIDPPPVGTDNDQATFAPDANAAAGEQVQITSYFKDGQGYVVPVSMKIPKTVEIAKKSLEYMVAGGPGESMLPQGFQCLLPAGTQVKGINIVKDQKLAIVDFSREFAAYDGSDERKLMEAVTWTLTGFPSIDKVQLWVEGMPLKEMPVARMPLDEPLSRAVGINLEYGDSLDMAHAVPVTLYFLGQAEDRTSYYVPVTRMVRRTDNIGLTAMRQLVAGPGGHHSHLYSVLAPETEILNIKLSDDGQLATINFNDYIVGPDQTIPKESLDSVLLSLTETTGAQSVQFLVNGHPKVNGPDNQTYTIPVARPVHVNELKL